jgi:undecaprenyl-diphosphatase
LSELELVWRFALLGVVQGLTEFLPVSSDGHLALGEHLLGFSGEDTDNLALTVALHIGTLFAVVIYLGRDLIAITRGMFGRPAPDRPLGWPLALRILVCCIPAGIVGVLFEDKVEALFDSLYAAGVGFAITALVLLATLRARGVTSLGGITYLHAFLIGCAQVTALAPGISRSGTTIATGMLLGLAGTAAGRFSFLVSVPIITGAIVFKLDDILAVPSNQYIPLVIGIAFSLGTGLLALWLLDQLLKRGRFHAFAWYLLPLAAYTLYTAANGS